MNEIRRTQFRRWCVAFITVGLFCTLFLTTLERLNSAELQSPSGSAGDLASLIGNLEADRLVDLCYTFDETTIYWPTDKPFRWEKNAWGPTKNGYWYASANYAASEHGGTHLDSPIHFAEKGDTTEKIALDRLIGPVAVIDISEKCAKDPNYELSFDDIRLAESNFGSIVPGSILVVRTGWGTRWPDKKAYLGTDTPGDTANLSFPGISPAAAETIVERRVKGVAIDTASLDRGLSKDFQAHRILNAAGIYGIENLASAQKLPVRGAVLIALPMKIKGGSGGPVRVMAILPKP